MSPSQADVVTRIGLRVVDRCLALSIQIPAIHTILDQNIIIAASYDGGKPFMSAQDNILYGIDAELKESQRAERFRVEGEDPGRFSVEGVA